MITAEHLDEIFAGLNRSKRRWALPLLRALDRLGGEAPVPAVRAEVRRVMGSAMTEAQLARVEGKNYIGWARFELVSLGLMEKSSRGKWALSEAGRALVERTRDLPLESFADVLPGDASAPAPDAATERVEATSTDAYEVPVLRALRGGPLQRARLLDVAVASIEDQLLPGDRRIGTPGLMVARYRSGWTLSKLKSKGEVRSPSAGLWELTAAGRQRLEAEEATWDFSKFPVGTATVLPEGAETADLEPSVGVAPAGVERTFESLAEVVEDRVFEALRLRLRPDLGPTPKDERVRVPRNVIFYGPPGTGKTFVAQEVARALTGSEAPEEGGRWSIVQFHPSYAYEDFVQGLRPNIEETTLRYGLARGPFLRVCQDAAEDPDHFHVLIIDEINRGDPARIFGELLYGLEYRGHRIELPLGGQLEVPPNLVVLGTMNSVDRSVALVDYALRRRFAFVRLSPSPEVIRRLRSGEPAALVAAVALDKFNTWLRGRLSPEHELGHSFFLNLGLPLDGPGALASIWQLDLRPLLEEYFFGDREGLESAEAEWRRALLEAEDETQEDGDEAPLASP